MMGTTNNSTMRAAAAGLLVAGLTCLVTGISACAAQGNTNSPPVPDYRFIAQRNIFNPNRYATSDEHPQFSPQVVARAPGFALVGTMIYDKGAFAFFDGTESQYKKVIKNSGSIADYQVAEINAKYVTLQANTNRVTLPVGMQMKRIGESWELVAGTDLPFVSSGGGGSSEREYGNRRFGRRSENGGNNSGAGASAVTPAAPSSASSADVSEVMKRLMQQREKELQK